MADPTLPSEPPPSSAPALPRHVEELLQEGVRRRGQGYRGRFAPSPSGALHRGNLRTALLGWLEARLRGGEWLLRIDDLDTPRNRCGAEEAILADLRWLGLDWDAHPLRQSARRGLYATVLAGLRGSGALYPCRCSRRMLADISAPHGPLAVYPGLCRNRDPAWGVRQGRLPSWRLALPPGAIVWLERFSQPGCLDGPRQVGDTVVRRADGVMAYHLATAVDELAMGISDVLRGEDLWSSTGPQVAVMAALGMPPPRYGHMPLWCDADGQRLSKREGAEGVAGFRERGFDAAAVIGELAASLNLVPAGSRLSAAELLGTLQPADLERCLRRPRPNDPQGAEPRQAELQHGVAMDAHPARNARI
jgi:glutamyl-tRNA synthetase